MEDDHRASPPARRVQVDDPAVLVRQRDIGEPLADGRHDRMNEVLFRHSLENRTVVTAMAVGTDEFAHRQWPTLIRARVEGVAV